MKFNSNIKKILVFPIYIIFIIINIWACRTKDIWDDLIKWSKKISK